MPLGTVRLHHVVLIVSDCERSKAFYTEVLGLPILAETYRKERASWKLDLALENGQLELFSFRTRPRDQRGQKPVVSGISHSRLMIWMRRWTVCRRLALQ